MSLSEVVESRNIKKQSNPVIVHQTWLGACISSVSHGLQAADGDWYIQHRFRAFVLQVAAVSGDVRRCLELLRRAAEITDAQSRQAAAASAASASNQPQTSGAAFSMQNCAVQSTCCNDCELMCNALSQS